jgi:hypothetical protein
MINMHTISLPHYSLLHHDGAGFVPSITTLDLLWFSMVGLVFFGIVARHFVLRRGKVVVRMCAAGYPPMPMCLPRLGFKRHLFPLRLY